MPKSSVKFLRSVIVLAVCSPAYACQSPKGENIDRCITVSITIFGVSVFVLFLAHLNRRLIGELIV